MLQTINDKAKGWVAYTIVGLIAVPFALFGISSYLDGGHGGLVAATVNGEEIPVQQVQGVVLQQRQRLAQMFGGRLPPNMNEDVIKNQALDQVVNQVLLRQEAEKNGYRASNQEVYDTISNIPAFQTNGQFNSQSYEQLLIQQHRSKSEFESQIRDGISNQQFSQSVINSAFIPNSSVTKYQGLQNQSRDVEIYTIEKVNYESEISVSDDEVKNEFEKNSKDYMTTEKLKLSYVLLKQDDIAANLSPDEDKLKLFYDDNQSRYMDPEKRKLAHIVINVDDDDKKDEARSKAKKLFDQINSGEKTFEEIAKSESEDEESAKNNGEIGIVKQGESGLLFDTTAFSSALFKGSMSEVVETESGYEIIKVLDIIPAKIKPLEEVRAEVQELYNIEEAEKIFLGQSDELQTLAFENDSSLDGAADAVGLEVLTSDWIEKSALNVQNAHSTESDEKDPLSFPKVIAAAYGDEVLNGGKNSELIEIDAKTVMIIRLHEHELPKPRELKEVEVMIKAIITDDKLRDVVLAKGNDAIKVLRDKSEWSALQDLDVSDENIKKSDGLKRSDTDLEGNVLRKIFSMKKPESEKKSFDTEILDNGDYVLISLLKVTDDTAEIDETLQQGYIQALASRESAAVIAALREKAEVELFTENIQ